MQLCREDDVNFIKNCWYMAAWAGEIGDETILARRICTLPILFLRDRGKIGAILDTCPHRFAPLSRGTLQNGTIVCGYHGLAFNSDGTCVHNPHGQITSHMKVRSFPTVERYRAIWIWMGELDLADPALIPNFDFHNIEFETAISTGYLHGNADYRLYVDNIMDLSHADFLHAATLGGGSFVGTRQQIWEDDFSLTTRWSQNNVPASPLHISLGSFPANALLDRFTEVKWYPPGTMTLTSAFGLPGTPEPTYSKTVGAHVMTPETPGTLHYFYSTVRNFKMDDAKFNDVYANKRDQIFALEDNPMIEDVQKRMGDRELFELRPLLLKSDAAAVRVRRRIKSMIDAEREVGMSGVRAS